MRDNVETHLGCGSSVINWSLKCFMFFCWCKFSGLFILNLLVKYMYEESWSIGINIYIYTYNLILIWYVCIPIHNHHRWHGKAEYGTHNYPDFCQDSSASSAFWTSMASWPCRKQGGERIRTSTPSVENPPEDQKWKSSLEIQRFLPYQLVSHTSTTNIIL